MANESSMAETVRLLSKDVWHGNGKPGLCTRMEVEEGRMDNVEKRVGNIGKMFWAVILLLLTILGTQVGELMSPHHEASPSRSYIE